VEQVAPQRSSASRAIDVEPPAPRALKEGNQADSAQFGKSGVPDWLIVIASCQETKALWHLAADFSSGR
jgi:hypothetical protein